MTPLLPVNEELLNDEYLKSLHRGKLVDNLYEDEVENVESNHILHRQAGTFEYETCRAMTLSRVVKSISDHRA